MRNKDIYINCYIKKSMDEKFDVFPDCLKCRKGKLVPCGSVLNGIIWVCSNHECDYKIKKN
jgi:hypothetical protein